MLITHSIPRHDCFLIMQPYRGNYTSRCFLANKEAGELYELRDIETGEVTQAVLLDYFVYTLQDLPDSISYIAYGHGASVIKKALQNRFPDLSSGSKIEVLLLKKK